MEDPYDPYIELRYLIHDAQQKLNSITSSRTHFSTTTLSVIKTLQESYQQLENNLPHTSIQHGELELRSLQGILAAVIMSSDWQSPSFASSGASQAGRQTGKIAAAINDYKRDQHLDARRYEQQFLKAYIDHPITQLVQVYTTNSGMAALTTILGFLIGEKKITGPIVVGKSTYFETKILLQQFFPHQIIEVDEHDSETIAELLKTTQPSVLFFDTICNSPNVALPNLSAIVSVVRQQQRSDLYLVLDNTGLSVTCQPLSFKRIRDPYLNLICWESLLKYHQFGMDRVNAGIIYSSAKDDSKLYDYRGHMGTNLSDTASLTLPMPNRKVLTNRLHRLEKNANYLAQQLHHANFPNLPHHPSYSYSKHLSFHGGVITLSFHEQYQRITRYQTFMKKALTLAKKADVLLIGGTSFGFSTTRIYIPASRPGQGVPFLRIAVGTEPTMEFTHVTEVIIAALSSL